MIEAKDVLHVDEADDVVDGLPVEGNARIARLHSQLHQFQSSGLNGRGGNARAVDHDLPRRQFAQAQGIAQQATLIVVE